MRLEAIGGVGMKEVVAAKWVGTRWGWFNVGVEEPQMDEKGSLSQMPGIGKGWVGV